MNQNQIFDFVLFIDFLLLLIPLYSQSPFLLADFLHLHLSTLYTLTRPELQYFQTLSAISIRISVKSIHLNPQNHYPHSNHPHIKMSHRTNLNTPQQSLDGTQFQRSPNKNTSTISQMSINPNDYLKEEFVRNPSTQKHKTFAGVDSTTNLSRKTYEPDRYHMTTTAEKKMFMALALAEKFIKQYEQQKIVDDEDNKRLHEDRKKAFQLNSSSQWKSIEPVSHEHLNQQQSYEFLVQLRNQLKAFFRHNYISEIKKRREKLSLIYKEEKLQSIEQTEKQSIRQSSLKKLQPVTFITADFNATTLSQNFPQVNLMAVSSLSPNIIDLLKNNKTMSTNKLQTKFTPVKFMQTKSRLRIHPAKNKYQSRKKEQIRLFMQLDQKTQHLENFRSQEGKFFKLNENLKVAVRNVNMCRIVLLNKKPAIMQQFGRLGDDSFYKAINDKLASMQTNIKNKQNSRHKENYPNSLNKAPNINIKTPDITYQRFASQTIPQASSSVPRHTRNNSTDFQPVNAYKQKALRIKNYIQETSRYFAEIQSFLVEFLKNDKGYENYKKENSLKEKISGYQQISEQEKFYRQFIDKCFHVSQISRLYFNALNQFAYQNISLKQMKLLNKNQLDRENKKLIELRYALIYMQKQCENTTESTFFNKTCTENMFGKLSKTVSSAQLVDLEASARSNVNTSQTNVKSLLKNNDAVQNSIKPTLLKQTHNTLHVPNPPQNQQSIKPISSGHIKSVTKLTPVQSSFDRQYANKNTTGMKRQSRQRQPRVSTNSVKEEEADIHLIWKTFYDKKFSSKAIRIRLY